MEVHMKNKYILIALLSFAWLLSSCEKVNDFLTREPINEFSAETFFSSESELEIYANGMLNSWLPNYSEPSNGDAFNDLIATKSSTEFFRSDVVFDSVKQGGWESDSWSWLRRVNYMLANMEKSKGVVSPEIYNHYEGVARFWRAFKYIEKINLFSNVPWTDKYLQPSDEEELFSSRDDREYVFSKVTEDLLFACKNCMAEKFFTSGRVLINKYVVNAFASRVFLYEATFRRNNKNNPATGKPWTGQYEKPEQLLQYAADAAKEVIDSKAFSLVKDWESLFVSASLQGQEVIWGRSFSEDLSVVHRLTGYFHSSTLGNQYSATKDLVMMFLKKDGTPVTTGEQSINEEFSGRDPRLGSTVLGPGRKVYNGTETNSYNEYPDFTWCVTGYQIIKWSLRNAIYNTSLRNYNSIPIIRYAEVLLNYAEAMNELGKMNESIWNETVGALRTRAGVKNIYPGSAAYVKDPILADYYSRNLKYAPGLSDITLEIRRERVTELTFESGLRQLDVYRYGQADLIARRFDGNGWRGIWVSEEDAKNGFTFEKTKYTFDGKSNTSYNYPIKDAASAVNGDWYFSEGNHGYVVYKYNLHWEDKMYCRPIPQSALTLNPELGQNTGWN